MRARELASGELLFDRRVYFPDGTQRYAHGHTLDELAIDYARLLKERAKASSTRKPKAEDPTRMRIGDLADMWMDEHVATLTDNTDSYYRIALTYRVAPYLYDTIVAKLDRRTIGKWRTQLMAEQAVNADGIPAWNADGSPKRAHSNRCINAGTAALKAMFGWAIDSDIVTENPLHRLKLLPEDTRGVEIYSPAQIMQMAEHMWRHRIAQTRIGRGSMEPGRAYRLAVRDQTMIIALASLGVRVGELAGLRIRDYNDGRDRDADGAVTAERELGWMHVRQQVLESSGKIGPLKGKRHRRIPVVPGLRRALDWYLAAMPERDPDSFLFPGMRSNDQTTWRHVDISKWRTSAFKPAAAAAGLSHARPHDMRHAFASMMIEFTQGRVPMMRLAKMLGHTNTKLIEDIYGHVYDEVADGLFAGFNAALFGDAIEAEAIDAAPAPLTRASLATDGD